MSSIIKKSTTRWKLHGKSVEPGTQGAVKITEETKKYYGQFKNSNGKTVTKVLSTDKSISNQMLAKLQIEVEREKVGLSTPFDKHYKKPLLEHLEDYLDTIKVKGRKNDEEYIDSIRTRITRILVACKFKTIPNFDSDMAQAWVAKQLFSAPNFGVLTANAHLQFLKSFGKWLVRSKKMTSNPFDCLVKWNVEEDDPLHPRRAMTPEDWQAFIQTTLHSTSIVQGVGWSFSGLDRYRLYQVAGYTGLRAKELAALTRSSFDFSERSITVKARNTKNTKNDLLPIHSELPEIIQSWVEGLKSKQHLFPGTWAAKKDGHRLVKQDLKDCGMEYETEDGFFDFHAIRGQYITTLVRAGVPMADVQKLARHANITTTARYYVKLSLADKSSAIEKMSLKPKPKPLSIVA